MAGKILSGVGEDKGPSIRIADDDDDRPRLIDEDDTRGLHSGPTVVDDQKVADVLKKLRSLDTPPGPLTGVTEAVVDTNSSEQTRIESQPIQVDSGPTLRPSVLQALNAEPGPASLEDVMYPLKRATSIGRGSSTPTDAQPVTVPPAAAQGTLFGRSIHLPDVNAPDAADIELSSGAVHFLDGAPPSSQPFPLADRPAVVVPPPATRPVPRFHTPYDADLNTQLVPSRAKAFKRVVAFVGGLSVVGAGLWAWSQYSGPRAISSPSAAAAPAAATPAIVPLPSGSAPAPAAAPPAPAAAPTPPPAATAKAATPEPPRPAEVAAAPSSEEPSSAPPARAPERSRSRHSGRSGDRHVASKPAPPAAEEPAAAEKPSHRKHAGVAEDPDATMAPSD